MDLSIIIPIYNTGKFLVECLDSLNLTQNDVEVVLVDDGSTDDSYVLANKYVSDNVKILYQSHKGVSAARNLGLSAATRKYVMFLDSDDKLTKFWNKNIEKELSSDTDIVYFLDWNPGGRTASVT